MIEITQDLTSSAELRPLLDEANATPFIADLRLEAIMEMKQADTIRFVYVDGQLGGFTGWIPINARWAEAGPFFVSERYRGHGLGKRVIQTVIEQGERDHVNQCAITRNPAVKHILSSAGFQETRLRLLPLSVQWFLLRKLSLLKLIRFLQKRYPEPTSCFVLLRK